MLFVQIRYIACPERTDCATFNSQAQRLLSSANHREVIWPSHHISCKASQSSVFLQHTAIFVKHLSAVFLNDLWPNNNVLNADMQANAITLPLNKVHTLIKDTFEGNFPGRVTGVSVSGGAAMGPLEILRDTGKEQPTD